MLKKIYLALLAVFLLVGCQNADQTRNDQIQVSITISVDHGAEIVVDETVQIDNQAILFDVLDEHYDIEATPDGFITAIEGIEQTDEDFWIYTVNEEDIYVGAKEYQLSDQDHVVFDLQKWE